MNYKKTYKDLIDNARNRVNEGKIEKHHIIPRSFGGSDESENLVELTHREHYIAHLLLYKMQTDKRERHQMLTAVIMMGGRTSMKINSRIYQKAREEFGKRQSERMRGELHPMYGTKRAGEDNPFFGKKHSAETRCKLTEKAKDRVMAVDTRTNKKVRISSEDFYKYDYYVGNTSGQSMSEEVKQKISQTLKGKVFKRGTCVHCGREMDIGNLAKSHNDKCKSKILKPRIIILF